MAECRGLAPLARGHALVSTEARPARPVDIPSLVGVGRLALPRLFDLESNRSAARLTTRRSATRDLHPEGSAILSRRGLLFPLKPVAAKLVGMKGLAPPRLPDSESGPSAIRVEPHAHWNWHSRKDPHPHLRRSKRRALVIELRQQNLLRKF